MTAPPAPAAGPLTCSAKGCQEPARWTLLWNNPKLHTPDRRKQWVACDAHRQSLAAFLSARGFFKEAQPLPGTPTASPTFEP